MFDSGYEKPIWNGKLEPQPLLRETNLLALAR
jgi:hypothetical protein